MNQFIISSPIGFLQLMEEEDAITRLDFLGNTTNLPESNHLASSELLEKAARQLEEYFKGQRKQFSLPLKPKGTTFQKTVWKALCDIPYGKVCSYKDIAETIHNPKAFRAVGMANHNNPIAIFIPCHRVIGADGSMTGYGGGLFIKEYLLRLEGYLS